MSDGASSRSTLRSASSRASSGIAGFSRPMASRNRPRARRRQTKLRSVAVSPGARCGACATAYASFLEPCKTASSRRIRSSAAIGYFHGFTKSRNFTAQPCRSVFRRSPSNFSGKDWVPGRNIGRSGCAISAALAGVCQHPRGRTSR